MAALLDKKNIKKEKRVDEKWIRLSPSPGVYVYKLI